MKWVDYREKLGIGFNDNNKFQMLSIINQKWFYLSSQKEKMMNILDRDQINSYLHKYYKEHYGELNTDVWYEQPAANVWVFKRDNNYIILKCHILTGVVTAYVEN